MRHRTYNGFREVLPVDEYVDRVEVRAGASMEGDFIHDLPIWRSGEKDEQLVSVGRYHGLTVSVTSYPLGVLVVEGTG
jgi:hypothetical protein